MLNSALQITGADMANLQLSSGVLHIVAQYGFHRTFLDFFDCVRESEAACGAAFKRAGRIIAEDVTQSPIFYGTGSGVSTETGLAVSCKWRARPLVLRCARSCRRTGHAPSSC